MKRLLSLILLLLPLMVSAQTAEITLKGKVVDAQLPTAILKPSSTGTGTDRYEFTYDFDEDGYVTEVTWKDGGDDYKLEFNYVVL